MYNGRQRERRIILRKKIQVIQKARDSLDKYRDIFSCKKD